MSSPYTIVNLAMNQNNKTREIKQDDLLDAHMTHIRKEAQWESDGVAQWESDGVARRVPIKQDRHVKLAAHALDGSLNNPATAAERRDLLESLNNRAEVPLEELMHLYLFDEYACYRNSFDDRPTITDLLCREACAPYKSKNKYLDYSYMWKSLKNKSFRVAAVVKSHLTSDLVKTAVITLASMYVGKYLM